MTFPLIIEMFCQIYLNSDWPDFVTIMADIVSYEMNIRSEDFV